MITPSGVTYERAVLLEHLDKVPLLAKFVSSFFKVAYSVYLEVQLIYIYLCIEGIAACTVSCCSRTSSFYVYV